MLIVVEGPDMGGKTTLVDTLSKDVFPSARVVRMLGGRTEEHAVTRKRTYDTMYEWSDRQHSYVNGLPIICERFHPISDEVYRSLDDKPHIFNKEEVISLYRMLGWRGVRVVYCRPSFMSVDISKHVEKGDDDPDWMDKIRNNVNNIFRAYDFEMMKLVQSGAIVIHYDWTVPWANEILLKGLK